MRYYNMQNLHTQHYWNTKSKCEGRAKCVYQIYLPSIKDLRCPEILKGFKVLRHRDSSVSTVTDRKTWRTARRVSVLGRKKDFFSSPMHPDILWSPPRLIDTGRLFLRWQDGQGVNLTTLPYLLPRLRTSAQTPLFILRFLEFLYIMNISDHKQASAQYFQIPPRERNVSGFCTGKKYIQKWFIWWRNLIIMSRSQWPRGLKRGSAAVRLLGMRDRIPPGAWM
jgi:hypothetical protein